MKEERLSYTKARDTLLEHVAPVGTERVSLWDCVGRVLARQLTAAEDVPAFDRSPYDGYALRASDTVSVPVTLRITEEIPAGATPTAPVVPGTAAKILTGAPIPEGADAVINYEATEFTAETVTLRAPVKAGSNIVHAGEDVKKGAVLLQPGQRLDPGAVGTLAGQGVDRPEVFRVPKVAVLSTGSELVEAGACPAPGKIRNSSAYALCAALKQLGMEPVFLGIAGDDVEAIAALFQKGLADCDAVISTGGVSVGDYDLTPAAMERADVEILFRGVDLKPGMACAYGVRDGKPVCALSGNPAAAFTNFYAVALPALRRLCGWAEPVPPQFPIRLRDAFGKKSRGTRLLRGILKLEQGFPELLLPGGQGNAVLSSAIGCNVMAIIPAGSDPLPKGTLLQAFFINEN